MQLVAFLKLTTGQHLNKAWHILDIPWCQRDQPISDSNSLKQPCVLIILEVLVHTLVLWTPKGFIQFAWTPRDIPWVTFPHWSPILDMFEAMKAAEAQQTMSDRQDELHLVMKHDMTAGLHLSHSGLSVSCLCLQIRWPSILNLLGFYQFFFQIYSDFQDSWPQMESWMSLWGMVAPVMSWAFVLAELRSWNKSFNSFRSVSADSLPSCFLASLGLGDCEDQLAKLSNQKESPLGQRLDQHEADLDDSLVLQSDHECQISGSAEAAWAANEELWGSTGNTKMSDYD